MTAAPELLAFLRKVEAEAAKRGMRVVAAEKHATGWRFEYAKVKPKRERQLAEPGPRRIARGAKPAQGIFSL